MLKTVQHASAVLRNQQIQLARVGNNVANVNTWGYKTDKQPDFTEAVRQALSHDGVTTKPDAEIPPTVGLGTRIIMINNKDFSQGALKETGRELDLAIEGEGFFALTDPTDSKPDKVLYSRAGVFEIDTKGRLVNPAGYYLDGIQVPPGTKELKISDSGQMTAVVQGKDELQEVKLGQITLQCFENPGELQPVGHNMLAAGENVIKGKQAPGAIRQGYLEQSNVNLIDEITSMINVQKAHSFGARVLTTADEMWGISNNLRK